MANEETLSPMQFRFLDSIMEKERSGAVIHELIEDTFGEITRNRFRNLAATLIKRKLIEKRSREKSQARFYRITESGANAHRGYSSTTYQNAGGACT